MKFLKPKILIVEDESIEALNFELYLNSFGYHVVGIASTGEDAIRKVDELNPDLVLMDIVLKGDMDGIEAASKIKEKIDIPLVYLTAHPDENALKRAKLTSPYGYIVKPIQKSVLQNTIELALYKHSMERKLKESQEHLENFFNNAPIGIFQSSVEGKLYQVNKSLSDMLWYESPEELISTVNKTDIENKLFVEKEKRSLFLSEVLDDDDWHSYENRIYRKDGSIITIEISFRSVKDQHGTVKYLEGFVKDITERKKAEEILLMEKMLAFALSESSDLKETLNICLNVAIRISRMDSGGIYLIDDDSGDMELEVHFGLSDDFITTASYYKADSPSVQLVMKGQPIYTPYKNMNIPLPEARLKEDIRAIAIIPITYHGKVIASLNVASHTLNKIPEQNKKALETISSQISGAIVRSKAEKALFESEKRYRELVDNSLLAIFETSLNGEILYANEAMTKITGHSFDDLKDINIIQFYENTFDREKFIENIKKFNSLSQKELKAISKTGETYDLIINAHLTSNNTISGMIMDISERKRNEDKIKKSLEEKELLLNEIHHRVKNNLQIISSLLNLQEIYVTEDPAAINVLKESQNRVVSMAMIHEMLYQSKDINRVNLSDYIKNLVTTLSHSYGKSNVEIIMDVEETYLNIETAVPCGLIINELVSNSFKHAFPDKEGELSICLDSQENCFRLVISDDGVGFPENVDFQNIETSLGLKLVNILVKQIEGSIEVDRTFGTKFSINFKEQEYKKRTDL